MVQAAPGLPSGRLSLDKPSLEHGGFGAAARASIEATLRRASGEAVASSEPPAQPALRPDDEAWAMHEPVTEVSCNHVGMLSWRVTAHALWQHMHVPAHTTAW